MDASPWSPAPAMGLGRCYALELARRGDRVVVNDLGGDVHGVGADASVAAGVVEEIRAFGGDAVANSDTVATPEGGSAIIATALESYGRIDALVCNAGILRNDTVVDADPCDVDLVLSVHLRGAFNVLRPAMRAMAANHYGRVVMISSAVGVFGNTAQAAYAAAKGGVFGLANAAALEGEPYGILVNTVLPLARTRMMQGMGDKGHHLDPDVHSRFLAAIAPEAVVPLVTFLASDACTTTHTAFSAGAGRFARVFVGLTPAGRRATRPLCALRMSRLI
jgi:NAD(P)-dependent dehydrogenase (short-subunit alcohol dehydrogenase family)